MPSSSPALNKHAHRPQHLLQYMCISSESERHASRCVLSPKPASTISPEPDFLVLQPLLLPVQYCLDAPSCRDRTRRRSGAPLGSGAAWRAAWAAAQHMEAGFSFRYTCL